MTITLEIGVTVAMPLLTVTIFLAFLRLIKGPSLPDRVVALDIMSTAATGVIAIYAIASGEAIFLDVAMILALVSFLGTVAFAFYIQNRAIRTRGRETP